MATDMSSHHHVRCTGHFNIWLTEGVMSSWCSGRLPPA